MPDCLFCRIVKKEIPGRIVHEDSETVAFEDLRPQAPVHILVVPKKHIESLATVAESEQKLLGTLLMVVQKLAKARNLLQEGFRTVINSGPAGGQTVFHLHVHLLAGRQMHWPPG